MRAGRGGVLLGPGCAGGRSRVAASRAAGYAQRHGLNGGLVIRANVVVVLNSFCTFLPLPHRTLSYAIRNEHVVKIPWDFPRVAGNRRRLISHCDTGPILTWYKMDGVNTCWLNPHQRRHFHRTRTRFKVVTTVGPPVWYNAVFGYPHLVKRPMYRRRVVTVKLMCNGSCEFRVSRTYRYRLTG